MNPFTDLLDLNDQDSYVALLKQEGLTQQEAEKVFESLRMIYEKHQDVFDILYWTRHGLQEQYEIKETDAGPRISKSRTMIYDILDDYNKGATRGEIAFNFNLKLAQVDVAINYIQINRHILEEEMAQIKSRMADEKSIYQAAQQEIKEKVSSLPMTKERKAFYDLKRNNRQKREQRSDNTSE